MPPSLHITQPSVDAQSGSFMSTCKQGDDFNPGSGDMAALLNSRTMPKRKSLNGLFGVSMKEAESFRSRHVLEEPVEEETVIQPSPPYISRFADAIPRSKSTLKIVANFRQHPAKSSFSYRQASGSCDWFRFLAGFAQDYHAYGIAQLDRRDYQRCS